MIRRNFLKYSFALVLAMFGLAALAANNPPGPKPSETLIVTGNILESRALAEVAQFYAGCNVLLCHPEADGKVSYFLLTKGDTSVAITESINEFVSNKLAPKNIVVLGDSRYVPYSFDESLRARNQFSVVRMASADWPTNAKELASYLHKRRVASQYKKKMDEIREQLERRKLSGSEAAQ